MLLQMIRLTSDAISARLGQLIDGVSRIESAVERLG